MEEFQSFLALLAHMVGTADLHGEAHGRAWRGLRSSALGLGLATTLAVGGCGKAASSAVSSPEPQDADAGPPPLRARYSLSAAPMRFGDVPWPDDAYLDASGRVRVRSLPTAATADYADALSAALGELDGFGVRPTVYFRFEGGLKPDSLPATAQDSLQASASAFLIDADTASPNAFERVPVDARYEPNGFEVRMRPALPHALHPGRRYAAVLTTGLRAANGRPVGPAERFARIRDQDTALSDPRERAARAEYAPVLETLATHGVARDRVVALAVFHVQTLSQDLSDAHALIASTPAPVVMLSDARRGAQLDALLGSPDAGQVGLDQGGPHDHLGFMLQGSYSSPNLSAMHAGVHGAFERTAAGDLRTKGQDTIYFTLFVPLGVVAGASLPIAVVQHGLGGDRSDALPLANALAASGYATIAIDAPFHGSRSPSGDMQNRFRSRLGPDGFGDAPGDFVGQNDEAGDLVAFHPFYYRDAVRQGVVDLMTLMRVVGQGDWSALANVAPALADVKLVGTSVPFIGLDLGAELGLMLASVDTTLGGLVLAFPGGLGADGWFESPAQRQLASAFVSRLGRDVGELDDPASLLLEPDVDAWRALADRANVLGFAPSLARVPANVLMLMARDDEVVHNRGTEVLASALGAVLVGGAPGYVTDLKTDTIRPGGSFSGNFVADGGSVTRVAYVLEPATHTALTFAKGEQRYVHPIEVPYQELPAAQRVDNPIAPTMTQTDRVLPAVAALVRQEPARAGREREQRVDVPRLRRSPADQLKTGQSGKLPCFLGGFASLLFFSISSAVTMRWRVTRGWITASMKPSSAALKGLANFARYSSTKALRAASLSAAASISLR
jgi:hypothetical protein